MAFEEAVETWNRLVARELPTTDLVAGWDDRGDGFAVLDHNLTATALAGRLLSLALIVDPELLGAAGTGATRAGAFDIGGIPCGSAGAIEQWLRETGLRGCELSRSHTVLEARLGRLGFEYRRREPAAPGSCAELACVRYYFQVPPLPAVSPIIRLLG